MSDFIKNLVFLLVIVGVPFGSGWLAGKRWGHPRGQRVGAAVPILPATIYLFYQLSLPRDYDYGPDPANELGTWLFAVVICGTIGALAGTVSGERRARRGLSREI